MQNPLVNFYELSPLSKTTLATNHDDGNAVSIQETLIDKNASPTFRYAYLDQHAYGSKSDEVSLLNQIKQSRVPQNSGGPSNSHMKHAGLLAPIQTSQSEPPVYYPTYGELSPTEFPISASSQEGQSPLTKQSKRDRTIKHTPRPSNSFILYRREKHVEIIAQYKGVKALNNNVISKLVANMWRTENLDVKAHFAALADAEKKAHLLKYPDYKYRPRKAGPKKAVVAKKAAKVKEDNPISLYDQHIYNQPQPEWGMGAHMSSYPVHAMEPHRAEHERGFEGGSRFGNGYEGQFLPQESLLPPSDYNHAWPGTAWDMGLNQ